MIMTQSQIARLGIRATAPLALLVGVYLLFAGHNNPGGGFAAGLVFGAVVTLRTVAGLQRPTHATGIITAGMLIVAAVAIAPLFWGDPLLDMQVFSFEVPLLGKIKSGSALPFDIGVTVIVVGMVVALLDSLSIAALDTVTPPGVDSETP